MMTKAIDKWAINPEEYLDDRLGLAGMLFESCSSLLCQLIKSPAKNCLEPETYQCLRTQAHRFTLWGDGFGAKYGALDKILAESEHLRKTVIYFLNASGTSLTNLASQLSNSSQLSDVCEEIKHLQEQVDSTTAELQDNVADVEKSAQKATSDEIDTVGSLIESLSFSDSESSTVSNEVEETVEDLRRYIDCLLDLAPALENPAKNVIHEEKQHTLSGENDIQAEARPFFAEIMSRYPTIDNTFGRRLAVANWNRRKRLQAKLIEAQLKQLHIPHDEKQEEEEEDKEEHSLISDHSKISSWAVSNPTRRSLSMSSTIDRTAPSVTSSATSFGNKDSNTFRQRIPQLPEDHEWGTAFRCIVCGDILRDIDSPPRWEKHVFDDLQPYICSYPECRYGTATFASQRLWARHEFEVHRVYRRWQCFSCPEMIFNSASSLGGHIKLTHLRSGYDGLTEAQLNDLIYTPLQVWSQQAEKEKCPFCLTVVADTIPKFAAHVSRHMREVAIAAIPFSAYDDSDNNFQTKQGEDSRMDEFGNERVELLEALEALSESASSHSWMPPVNEGIPTLRSITEAYNSNRPLSQCVGVGLRNSRCRNLISPSRARDFVDAFKVVQESENVMSVELSKVETLARTVLCSRYHQVQATSVALTWLEEIRSNWTCEEASRYLLVAK